MQIFIIDAEPYCSNKYLKNKLKLKLITTIYERALIINLSTRTMQTKEKYY